MDRPGSKRILGIPLMVTAGVLIVLSGLVWAGVIAVAEGSRAILGTALLLAGLVDGGIGLMLKTRSED